MKHEVFKGMIHNCSQTILGCQEKNCSATHYCPGNDTLPQINHESMVSDFPERTVEKRGSLVFRICESSEAERERMKPLEMNERVCGECPTQMLILIEIWVNSLGGGQLSCQVILDNLVLANFHQAGMMVCLTVGLCSKIRLSGGKLTGGNAPSILCSGTPPLPKAILRWPGTELISCLT